jgi:hypothetical protein
MLTPDVLVAAGTNPWYPSEQQFPAEVTSRVPSLLGEEQLAATLFWTSVFNATLMLSYLSRLCQLAHARRPP